MRDNRKRVANAKKRRKERINEPVKKDCVK